jgi:hypothetical protein
MDNVNKINPEMDIVLPKKEWYSTRGKVIIKSKQQKRKTTSLAVSPAHNVVLYPPELIASNSIMVINEVEIFVTNSV